MSSVTVDGKLFRNVSAERTARILRILIGTARSRVASGIVISAPDRTPVPHPQVNVPRQGEAYVLNGREYTVRRVTWDGPNVYVELR